MTFWIVNAAGLLLIGLVVRWFWFSRPPARRAAAKVPVEILVEDGVYTPARIEVEAGTPVTLRFLRQDPSPCAEKVLFDDLGVSADLPLGQPRDISLKPDKPGEYVFTCAMRMYRGTLVVR